MYKNVVFDLDGTIVKSNNKKQAAIESFCQLRNFTSRSNSSSILRSLNRYQQCALLKGSPLTLSEIQDLDDHILSVYQPDLIDPGWYPLFGYLFRNNVHVSIVSALPSSQISRVIAQLGLHDLHHVIGCGSTSCRVKSDALKNILSSSFNFRPSAPHINLYIGDYIEDYSAAIMSHFSFYGIFDSSLITLRPRIKLFSSLLSLFHYLR